MNKKKNIKKYLKKFKIIQQNYLQNFKLYKNNKEQRMKFNMM